MTIPKIPIESHDVHSERLIAQAEDELAKGDRLQASEKAWGAVAHRLKVIADHRGWEYTAHRHVYGVVRQLSDELGNQSVRDLFAYANGLHQNYYADATPIEELAYEIDKVKELLDILNRVKLR